MIQRQPGPRAVERWATTLAREDARNVWVVPWLENLGRDITYAFRVIVHRPAFAAAMILVMGVGIGATTGVFGLLDRLVLQSLPGARARPSRLPEESRGTGFHRSRHECLDTSGFDQRIAGTEDRRGRRSTSVEESRSAATNRVGISRSSASSGMQSTRGSRSRRAPSPRNEPSHPGGRSRCRVSTRAQGFPRRTRPRVKG